MLTIAERNGHQSLTFELISRNSSLVSFKITIRLQKLSSCTIKVVEMTFNEKLHEAAAESFETD